MKPVDLSVQLLGHYGGDLEHAAAAWTSISRDLTPERLARVPAFLKSLADQGHHTPFERSTLHFLVETDIASHIHLLKHRIGVSVNAESARYKEKTEDKGYVPRDWPEPMRKALELATAQAYLRYHEAIDALMEAGYSRKRAKESARYFLPYATTITTDCTFNFRSFVHFQKLRNNEHAQKEIQLIAFRMLQCVAQIPDGRFGHSLRAFGLL